MQKSHWCHFKNYFKKYWNVDKCWFHTWKQIVLIVLYFNFTLYSVSIWGDTCKISLDKIFKLQKWAIRTILNSRYRSHTGPLFSKCNVLNEHDKFKRNHGIFVYNHHSNQLPPIFFNVFTKDIQTHSYQTRNGQDYNIDKTKQRKCFLSCN